MSYHTAPRAEDAASSTAWPRWITLIAGVLLFLAAFLLGYMNNTTAFWDNLILGALIAIFSAIALAQKSAGAWAEWVAGILGILAFISPWVLGFSNVSNAFLASIILGAITVIFAAVSVFMRRPAATAV